MSKRLTLPVLLSLCLNLGLSAAPVFLPTPTTVQLEEASTDLSEFTLINGEESLVFEATYLRTILKDWAERAHPAPGKSRDKVISLSLGKTDFTPDYRLEVSAEEVSIVGKNEAGVFHGIQTLLQMITLTKEHADFHIPTGTIEDQARYNWRGLMLDSSRHFQSVKEIKEFIDVMAHYKFNVFHWHLTDDTGWRIEIKSRPALTTKGAWRVPREGIWWLRPGPKEGEKATYGGFYTQEEIKDIVHYANERHIEIVPEVDVPGHCMAVLAAYPELSTTGGPFLVNPGSKFWNIVENTIDPSNPQTYQFLEDVFSEVAALFPTDYIHIGGDEATKKFWEGDADCKKFMAENQLKNGHELQSYFIKRVEKILQNHGKKLLGWDEILEGGLAETATVMSWRGVNGGNKAAQMGRDIVMAANSAYYFDLYQGHSEYEPATYGKLRLKKTYLFDYQLPKGTNPEQLLGLHGCLWTEEVPNQRHAQYMLWPRAFALAESAWSTHTEKDWPAFIKRVEAHFERFDFLDLNYATSLYDPIITMKKVEERNVISLATEVTGLQIHYTFDEGEVDHHYPVYEKPLVVPYGATTLRVRTYQNGQALGKLRTVIIGNINQAKKALFPTP